MSFLRGLFQHVPSSPNRQLVWHCSCTALFFVASTDSCSAHCCVLTAFQAQKQSLLFLVSLDHSYTLRKQLRQLRPAVNNSEFLSLKKGTWASIWAQDAPIAPSNSL